jgi:FtsP/CotA-like multicopper oxidase with cupredoxin domain
LIAVNRFKRRFPIERVAVLAVLTTLGLLAPPQLLHEEPRSASAAANRVYYIAADEVDWDYAPSGMNLITGQPFGEVENVFVERAGNRIGKVYRKSLYREYTDATFTARKPVDHRWQHLGMLGPLIRAEVGDTIEVHFKNNTRFPASIHPHGVRYPKDAEGAPYNDGTAGAATLDDAVAPGASYVYRWSVPERAGPGPHDGSSVIWMYHGHVDEPADTNAGLVGPIVITRQASARPDASPVDVDREFVIYMSVVDENASPYLAENVRRFAGRPATVKPDDEDFIESNLMHAVNGFVYGNLPGLDMAPNQRIRWYVISLGTEVDLHGPHWHGQTGLFMGMRTDMVELLPGSMKVLDMTVDEPGTWLLHCHTNDHIAAGMQALFRVAP